MVKLMSMDAELFAAAEKVRGLFVRRGLSLSVAESCTGGFLSSALTDVPGASGYFTLGVVAYSAGVKQKVLGVLPATIEAHGVVSEATAREMAEGVRKLAGTDFSLSTTGNLGPEAIEGKQRGLLYIAASRREKTAARQLRLKGDREANKKEAVLSALGLLMELVEADEQESP